MDPLTPCPFLPIPDLPISAASIAALGTHRGPEFYLTALTYAQSLWLEGLPARALLLINRAMGCDLAPADPILSAWPIPYHAVAWILLHHHPDHFIGNPRRHWQHLATRMVEPRRDLRSSRAWACWYLSRLAMPFCPPDHLQLSRENITEPSPLTIRSQLNLLGLPNEAETWDAACSLADSGPA
jgi:hypothetical protein